MKRLEGGEAGVGLQEGALLTVKPSQGVRVGRQEVGGGRLPLGVTGSNWGVGRLVEGQVA